VLQKVNALEFLPYAFLKWEFDQHRPKTKGRTA